MGDERLKTHIDGKEAEMALVRKSACGGVELATDAAHDNPKQDLPGVMDSLISFESGHYKKVRGKWKGDSVWTHFFKADGGQVHVNKDKVEYIETFPVKG